MIIILLHETILVLQSNDLWGHNHILMHEVHPQEEAELYTYQINHLLFEMLYGNDTNSYQEQLQSIDTEIYTNIYRVFKILAEIDNSY